MTKQWRKCIVKGEFGIVMRQWTHTTDVWFPSTKRTMNIKTSLIKLLPKEPRPTNQLRLF